MATYRDSNVISGQDRRRNVYYDDVDGIYRLNDGDRIYTYDELVSELEGDVTRLDFKRSVESYFSVRERLVAGLAAGIITRVDLDGEIASNGHD